MSMSRDADSQPPFLTGANLPWVHYGIDFGANAWRPEGGIAQPDERAQLETAFARLAASGVRYVRWFLFCDGRAGITFSDAPSTSRTAGRPLGLDDSVFRDVDAALDIAGRHGIRIMFVLLDFLWCGPAGATRGVQMGGRAQVLSDPAGRDALLDVVLRPLLERYGDEPVILAWDVINEPEWIKTVEPVVLRAWLKDSVALIHSATSHPATVGSAGVRWRARYADLDLDFYQVHWYDNLKQQPSLETPIAGLGFDKPVLLGEFPTRGSKRTPEDIVRAARAAGYSGAFYWSVLAKDECSAGSTKQDPAYVPRT
jgi:hypothetical protein